MVSTMNSGPSHVMYHDRMGAHSAPQGRGGTAGAGRGTVVFGLEIEGHSMPATFKRTKVEPRDHMRENLRRLRNIQRVTRDKEQEAMQPVKALWKSSKYENVESKIKDEMRWVETDLNAPRPHSATYLRAHSRTGFVPQSARPASVEPSEDNQKPRYAFTYREMPLKRHDIDFIQVNGVSAKRSQLLRSMSMTSLTTPDGRRSGMDGGAGAAAADKYKVGEVPRYLVDRKLQWVDDERKRRAGVADPEMPPGHRLMPEAERRDTLEKIKQKKKELEQDMSTMPIATDTLRARRKKEETEQKLGKVEEAIKIFSRQKVFVKLDA